MENEDLEKKLRLEMHLERQRGQERVIIVVALVVGFAFFLGLLPLQ